MMKHSLKTGFGFGLTSGIITTLGLMVGLHSGTESKFVFTLTFIIPILVLELSTAILVSVIWGIFMLCVLSFIVAQGQKTKSWRIVLEHLVIAVVVIVIAHYLGDWIALRYG